MFEERLSNMKNFYKLLIISGTAALTLGVSYALFNEKGNYQVSVSAAASSTYYNGADTSSPENLLASLKKGGSVTKIDSVGYSGLWNAYKTTDIRSDGKINDMYSSATNFRPGTDQDKGSHPTEGYSYNREHTIPKSWWGGEETNQGCDLFIVYPTDSYVNEKRGNYPYGEVDKLLGVTYSSKGDFSILGKSSLASYTGTVFEPNDKWKGDLARAYFYAVATYQTASWTSSGGSTIFMSSISAPNYGLSNYAVDLFMKWHLQDPVDDWEMARNDKVQNVQGNRNPFIDHPEWVNYIWGDGGDPSIHPQSVTISGPNKIGVGETTTLKAVITPSNATNQNVLWSSSNSSVLEVSTNGTITGKSVGTSIVTCITSDAAKIASLTIKVTSESQLKKGCNGSIMASSAIVSITSLIAFGLLFAKKKQE